MNYEPEQRSLLGNIGVMIVVALLMLLGGYTVITLVFAGQDVLALANAILYGTLILCAYLYV